MMETTTKLLVVGGLAAAGVFGYVFYQKNKAAAACQASGGTLAPGSFFSAGPCTPGIPGALPFVATDPASCAASGGVFTNGACISPGSPPSGGNAFTNAIVASTKPPMPALVQAPQSFTLRPGLLPGKVAPAGHIAIPRNARA